VWFIGPTHRIVIKLPTIRSQIILFGFDVFTYRKEALPPQLTASSHPRGKLGVPGRAPRQQGWASLPLALDLILPLLW